MNELILIILAFLVSPYLNSTECVFREDSFKNIRYRCADENGFLKEDSYGRVIDSRTNTYWTKDTFGNIHSSDGTIWRMDSFGNFDSSNGNRWRKDSFENWQSNKNNICREDSFGNLHCK